jgi:type II secretory pathway component GspD/PulD (secretin)
MNLYRFTIRTLLAFTLLPISLSAHAQKDDAIDCSALPTRTEASDCAEKHAETKTIFLRNTTTQNDANEIMVALRNVFDPGIHIYLVSSQDAMVVTTYPVEMAKVEALIHTLDRPHKTYRLTYTFTEVDGGKSLGTEHLAMVIVDGQRTGVKQGDKIPVATGSYTTENSSAQTQFTYLDIGLNIEATLTAYDTGALLRTKVEQSSAGQSSTIAGVTEPIVRQSVFEGFSVLTLGKPVMLGSIDVPNSTRRLDIAVVMDDVK